MAKKKADATGLVAVSDAPKERTQAIVKQEYVNLCARLGDIDYQLNTSLPAEKKIIYIKLYDLNEEFKATAQAKA